MAKYKATVRSGLVIAAAALMGGCGGGAGPSANKAPIAIGGVPAVRLNYKYEADVPGPSADTKNVAQDRNAAVQTDFDTSRPQELLDRTIESPDKQHVLAVYHRVIDAPSEYRL